MTVIPLEAVFAASRRRMGTACSDAELCDLLVMLATAHELSGLIKINIKNSEKVKVSNLVYLNNLVEPDFYLSHV
jgi:hypothetical protein